MSEKKYLESMGYDANEYIISTWPESQTFMEHFEEIELINDEVGYELFGDSAYIVPKEVYEIYLK